MTALILAVQVVLPLALIAWLPGEPPRLLNQARRTAPMSRQARWLSGRSRTLLVSGRWLSCLAPHTTQLNRISVSEFWRECAGCLELAGGVDDRPVQPRRVDLTESVSPDTPLRG
jgi:hypothetical protein